MKKILFFYFTMCLSQNILAQTDYCKDIKKTIDTSQETTNYDSPTSFLSVGTYYLDNKKGPLMLHFYATKKMADYKSYGLYITFADGAIWKDEGAHINCSYIDAEFGYGYFAVDIFDDDELDKLIPFKTKKIVKVQIADIIIPVDDAYATKFMAYVNCILALKQ